MTITPPEYARATVKPQTNHGLADLSALQHSRIALEFHFAAPVVLGGHSLVGPGLRLALGNPGRWT